MPLGSSTRLSDEVRSFTLPAEEDLFAELSSSVAWEDVGKGRRGAVLTRVGGDGGVPVVRTTTRYGNPAQRFRAVHERLARRIEERVGTAVGFNNALIETYTNAYTTMGSHSDQALDLTDGSYIAVFSCYGAPDAGPLRKLVFEAKEKGGERLEIPLAHNGVVVFSVESNRRLRHKIVLDGSAQSADSRWLGVTFRTSKTFIRFRDGLAYLAEGVRLTSADEELSREFYRMRRRENEETGFVYPLLTYTISESDLVPPV